MISNDSPIAKALIGKHVGDVVTVETPVGGYDATIKAVEVAETFSAMFNLVNYWGEHYENRNNSKADRWFKKSWT